MKRGFSLLEVVLAVGILGLSLPILLTHMAEGTGKMEKRMQEMLVTNAGKNVQNVLNMVAKAPTLDSNSQAYCGYRDGIFAMTNVATGFDGSVFVLVRETVKTVANGSVEKTSYALYPWDSKNQSPRLTLPHVPVIQSVILSAMAWINEVVLGDILSMEEGQAKSKASWAYAKVTESSYWHNKEYGAAQFFEYTSYANQDYGSSIVGNDAVARNYGQALYNQLTSNANDRLTNWNKLKQDPILGVIATQAIDAQFTVTEAMKNAGEGGAVSPVEAQATIRNAINAVWDFINGNEQYKKDYENTVHAYQVTYAFFEANPSQGAGSGSDIFNSNLNGTAANSQGAMAAAILMSLGSTQNILDAYLSGK